jgi:hypothetical protein
VRSRVSAPAVRVFPANAAWLACAAIAHNLLRAAGSLASLGYGKARGATIRRDLIDVAARTARHGHGHITLHLTRSLAPRTRMDDPVHRHLRPTPHSGLTSPDPVTAPASPTRPANPATRLGITDRPQE